MLHFHVRLCCQSGFQLQLEGVEQKMEWVSAPLCSVAPIPSFCGIFVLLLLAKDPPPHAPSWMERGRALFSPQYPVLLERAMLHAARALAYHKVRLFPISLSPYPTKTTRKKPRTSPAAAKVYGACLFCLIHKGPRTPRRPRTEPGMTLSTTPQSAILLSLTLCVPDCTSQ